MKQVLFFKFGWTLIISDPTVDRLWLDHYVDFLSTSLIKFNKISRIWNYKNWRIILCTKVSFHDADNSVLEGTQPTKKGQVCVRMSAWVYEATSLGWRDQYQHLVLFLQSNTFMTDNCLARTCHTFHLSHHWNRHSIGEPIAWKSQSPCWSTFALTVFWPQMCRNHCAWEPYVSVILAWTDKQRIFFSPCTLYTNHKNTLANSTRTGIMTIVSFNKMTRRWPTFQQVAKITIFTGHQ